MNLLLLVTTAIFTAIALTANRILDRFTARTRLKRPHTALVLVFRAWFAILALATFWLLVRQPNAGH